jgi:hypothetical protein
VIPFQHLPAGLFVLLALVIAPLEVSAQRAQVLEVEPNDRCDQAQEVGEYPSVVVSGNFDSARLGRQDLEYYAFEAEPGAILDAYLNLLGPDGDYGSAYQQMRVGLFDTSCRVLAWSDVPDAVEGDETDYSGYLRFRVGPEGRYVLGVTGANDVGFAGVADPFVSGSYFLWVGPKDDPPPKQPNYFIDGQVVDAQTGHGLSGHHPPYARLTFHSCRHPYAFAGSSYVGQLVQVCEPLIATVVPDPEGHFELVGWEWPSHPSGPGEEDTGRFLVTAWAVGYEPQAWVFQVDPGGEVSGVIALERTPAVLGQVGNYLPPIEFGAVSPCDDLPASGGTCRYSVEIVNRGDTRIRGVAWSNVQAQGTSAGLGYSSFTASRQQNINLRGESSTLVRFSFDVPDGIAEGAVICADASVSDRDDALLGALWTERLFCMQKHGASFVVLDRQ